MDNNAHTSPCINCDKIQVKYEMDNNAHTSPCINCDKKFIVKIIPIFSLLIKQRKNWNNFHNKFLSSLNSKQGYATL